jgi:hypothetical protein
VPGHRVPDRTLRQPSWSGPDRAGSDNPRVLTVMNPSGALSLWADAHRAGTDQNHGFEPS